MFRLPGLLPTPLRRIQAGWVEERSRRLRYFAGCDYFDLSLHPKVRAAAQATLRQDGLGVGASRRTTGNHPIFKRLEDALARFLDVPDVLLTSTGYLTNLAVAPAMRRRFTHLVIDERAHTSLHLAAQLTGLPTQSFAHRSWEEACNVVRRAGPRARVALLTDGMFSHDGSVAPLTYYRRILPANAWLWIDDAHGLGVLGKNGRGTVEHWGMGLERVVLTGTLSKALGSYGGVVVAPKELLREVIAGSGAFIGSTPLPVPLAAGAIVAIELLTQHPGWRTKLLANATYVRDALRQVGWTDSTGPGPVIPVLPETPEVARRLSRLLRKAGIHPPLIQYSSGPQKAYFRLAITHRHSMPALDALITAFGEPSAPARRPPYRNR